MKLIQFFNEQNNCQVAIVNNDQLYPIQGVSTVYELVEKADLVQSDVTTLIGNLDKGEPQQYEQIALNKRLLLPFSHPDPYHTWITGTGLTHLGSASSRDAMHQSEGTDSDIPVSDSMKMFNMGVKNGRMQNGLPAVQPEWFYKGNGLSAIPPGQAITQPAFALDGGEEPELAGLYYIDKAGNPKRIGFALGNEFSDHRMEKINYLYLAHSKLRQCSYGPELLIGELPDRIVGQSKILRNQKVIWEKEFLTGEAHMSHNLANLEYHHFKYDLFRQPGDVHVHFMGTSVLSFSDQIETKDGDVLEISADCFSHPLVNPLRIQTD
ncbi:MAG: AraD1 family protein [Cyclobacteriaceae bacterium]